MIIYMNFDNLRIKGDVTAKAHLHWIELVSLNYGVSAGSTPGGGVPKNEFECVKPTDSASNDLRRELMHSRPATVELHFLEKPDSVNPSYTILLAKAVLSGYSVSRTARLESKKDPWAGRDLERLTFRYAGLTSGSVKATAVNTAPPADVWR